MTIVVNLNPPSVEWTPLTAAQRETLAQIADGLSYPVCGWAVQSGRYVLPLLTDGDGGFDALARDGRCVSVDGFPAST